MDFDSVTAVLGDSPEFRHNINLFTDGNRISSETVAPRKTQLLEGNPKPATDFIEEFLSDKIFEKEMGGKVELTDSGLYTYLPKVIIGSDDRVRVNAPQAWPYCVHGHLVVRFPNGVSVIGTGTMVNRHHVLTAGHCVYSKANGGWATAVYFNAAQNENSIPFGTATAARLVSVKGWTENSSSDHDYGMVILSSNLGDQTGWFGVITTPNDNDLIRKRVNVSGYPGDKGHGMQMWTHADAIKSLTSERVFYDIDTVGGQSGSGVWTKFAGHAGEKVACIHTTGSLSGNGATRISRPKFDNIIKWFQVY